MFDPSKLDLDLDNKKKKTPELPSDAIQEDIIESQTSQPPLEIESNLATSLDEAEATIPLSPTDNEKQENTISHTLSEEMQSAPVSPSDTEENDNDKTPAPETQLYDININSLDDIILILEKNEYDFVLIEPQDGNVALRFQKEKVEQDVRYIKFPTYTNILIGTKTATKMDVTVQNAEQEGKSEIIVKGFKYSLIAKIQPHSL